jgi:phosphate transport system substrate-binding protein
VLRALAQQYTAQYPNRQVIVPDSTGSQGGVEVVGNGTAPIGRVSRLPNADERKQYGDFKYIEFARVPVTFVVSRDAGVNELSEQQICDIYSGRVKRWNELGGNDLPIAVQSRPESGSNMQTIRSKFACFAKLEIIPSARPNERNSDLVDSMKNFSGAIGSMPLSEAQLHGFKAVTIDHVAPDQDRYKLVIGLGFVYKKPLPPEVAAFIDYLKTAPAQRIMRQTGHNPASPREIIVQAQSPVH